MTDPSSPRPLENQHIVPTETAAPQPSEAEVGQALAEIERTSQQAVNRVVPTVGPTAPQTWWAKHGFALAYFAVVALVILCAGWVGQRALKWIYAKASVAQYQIHRTGSSAATRHGPRVDSRLQAQAEELLKRLTDGDAAAADLILAQSSNWTGKTQRTANTDRFMTTAINLPDLHAREAAIDALLAFDGVKRDESGLAMLKQALGNPNQRVWALWSLGALGHGGVDPVHTAKILESYLNDSDVRVRASAVDGLGFLATDETLPMLLDRFRNDPWPVVQERAACDMAESGMYTHAQRMQAAASLVAWLDDPLLTAQQRAWSYQALRDITGASLGSDAAAWKQWWSAHGEA